MTRKIDVLHIQEPTCRRKSNTTYKVTWGNNNKDIYDTIDDVIAFLELNKIESFTVIQGEDNNDLTGVIYSILNWRTEHGNDITRIKRSNSSVGI